MSSILYYTVVNYFVAQATLEVIVIDTKLFLDIDSSEISSLLACIGARFVNFKKDEFIIEEGEMAKEFGIILSGRARSIKWDASGRLIIITLIEKGGAIGVMLAASKKQASPVSVQVTEDAEVMMISFNQLINRCKKNCEKHEKLLRNYINVVAEKGLELHERINCLLEPTVRDKILTYLSRISKEQGSKTFTVPINRNIMAEYLNVERSALSRELSRMQKDGLIEYHGNSFKLKI